MTESRRVAGPAGATDGIRSIDLAAGYRDLAEELDTATRRVLASGRYIGGQEVEAFESEFAAFCGVPHGVSVASGTDALRFALIAAGVGEDVRQAARVGGQLPRTGEEDADPGPDEVLTSPLSFFATTEAISQAGARPVFVDVDPESLTLDPKRLPQAITSRTKAVLPIHLYGQTADMGPILDIAREHRLAVIEDACQAHGAQYRGRSRGEGIPHGPAGLAGALGDAGCFSFYPTKNLGGCGEGGFVTTSSAEVAARVRRLRDHGQSEKYVHAEEGYNGRLDALQAAILRVKLPRLSGWNARRRALAVAYSERLKALGLGGVEGNTPLRLPIEMPWGAHVYHLYTVRVVAGDDAGDARRRAAAGSSPRDRLREALLQRGIETGVHYPIPLHLQPAYAWMGLGAGSFPMAERAAREVLSLPLYPEMTEAQVDRVCEALRDALGRG